MLVLKFTYRTFKKVIIEQNDSNICTILYKKKTERIILAVGINKALKIPKREVRVAKLKEKKKILPFISTSNPNKLKP